MAEEDQINSIVENSIKAFRKDLVDIQGFISQEFVKITAQSGGQIDLNNNDIQQATHSLINADPNSPENAGKAVLSFTGTEQGIKEKIDKLVVKKNIPKELFEDFLKEMDQCKDNLTKKVSTKKGLQGLVTDRITTQLISNSIGLFDLDASGQPRGLSPDEKGDIVSKIATSIELPQKLVDRLSAGDNDMQQQANAIINKQISESFGTPHSSGATVIDRDKLNPDAIARATQEMAGDLNAAATKHSNSLSIVEQAINNISERDNITFTPKRREKIIKALAPKMAEFGSAYMENHQNSLVEEVEQSLKSEQTFFSKVFGKIVDKIFGGGGFSVSSESLDKIGHNLDAEHKPIVRQNAIKDIETSIYRNTMTNEVIAEKLNSFAQKMGKLGGNFTKSNAPEAKDIAEIRSQNPRRFDKIFNATKTAAVTKEIAEAVPSMQHHTSKNKSPTTAVNQNKIAANQGVIR